MHICFVHYDNMTEIEVVFKSSDTQKSYFALNITQTFFQHININDKTIPSDVSIMCQKVFY